MLGSGPPPSVNKWCRRVLQEGEGWSKSQGREWFPSHASVAQNIALHLDYKTFECFPSQRAIATLTMLSRRTVNSVLGDLVTLGFLETQRRGRGLLYRAVLPVHMSLDTCEANASNGELSSQEPVNSVPTELKENSKGTTADGTGIAPVIGAIPAPDPPSSNRNPPTTRPYPDDIPTTSRRNGDQDLPVPPPRWVTRAQQLEGLLTAEDQSRIRRKFELDPDAAVTFLTLMQLAFDDFEALWNEYQPP